jgi:AcrR family transcriptional regulator
MPPITSPDKPYHHGAVREGALIEGLKHLAEVGVAKFSLREVARRLGVTPTALYHHFPDKEDLLFALAREGLQHFQDMLTAAASSEGDGLAAMGAAYISFFLERPYYMDLLFRPSTKFDDRVRDIWGNTFNLIQTALEARGIPADENPYFCVWLWSGVHGLAGMLRDKILGNPEACGPDAPPVFRLYPDELLQKVIPLVGRMIGTAQNSTQN